MKQASAILLTVLACLTSADADSKEIVLRLRPEATAPVITRMTATEKVLLEAAPAGESNQWKQLDLKVPVEGYVPSATLTKGLAILQDTPVHFLPDANSETITQVQDGDLYEIKRVKDEWATVGINKKLTIYFQADALTSTAIPAITLATPKPIAAPIPAPPLIDLPKKEPSIQNNKRDFNPSLSVGTTALENLPPENVIWNSAQSTANPNPHIPHPESRIPHPTSRISDPIMVSPSDTQAREVKTNTPPTADQPHRLLTGILVREIEPRGPHYPIRLHTPKGRFIAYVDFSRIYIEDLSAYLDQRVILRGQIAPVRPGSRELVIFVHQILPGN